VWRLPHQEPRDLKEASRLVQSDFSRIDVKSEQDKSLLEQLPGNEE
jgi:hypothetical protein